MSPATAGRGGREERVEVAVVGGGPAGALTAALLAGLGHDVVLLEATPRYRWRACGVFAAPPAVAALRRLGMDERELAGLALPLAAMRLETRGGARVCLTYDGTGSLADSAVGFDREALDTSFQARALAAGAQLRLGARVTGVSLEAAGARLEIEASDGREPDSGRPGWGAPAVLHASVVVGADGLRSIVARAAGAARRPPFANRVALSFHVPGPERGASPLPGGEPPAPDARMVVLRDGYVGLAPVPGGRTNVGIVLGGSWAGRLRTEGAAAVAAAILASARSAAAGGDRAEPPVVLDRIAGVRPVSASVRRRSGDRWLLVGDAAGFLDPFTGEGLHRAFVSAELAAGAAHAVLTGRPGARLAAYDQAMRARFSAKDVVSRLVQAFLARPALFEYAARRLEARSAIRGTMGRVIGDLEPASRALDPRFLAALLAP